jgi:hypothetical protein
MNIPLDRLYHYIENIAQEIYGDRVIIYRFFPHGSKNIQDLNNLRDLESDWFEKQIYPPIWCNDQEPLNHRFYKNNPRTPYDNEWSRLWSRLSALYNTETPPINLNWRGSIFKKALLLHSEKRSKNITLYRQDNELIPVYYWSHAIIAQDWFRYAEYEHFQPSATKTFLIYNRAWTGTREYRLKFTDLLIDYNLTDQCYTFCNSVDNDTHYSAYKFNNPQWRPSNVLENYVNPTTAQPTYSADFDTNDYNSTEIEVVLETLFDDNRLHLTEKSLRPIACGHPFIIAGTYGSLAYLRSYGFQTFDTVWDESYDAIQDPLARLHAIVNLMKQIADWDTDTKISKMSQARSVADYNRKHFFSQEFNNVIIDELKTNLISAFDELKICNNYTDWIARWSTCLTNHPELVDFIEQNQDHTKPTRAIVDKVMEIAITGCNQE